MASMSSSDQIKKIKKEMHDLPGLERPIKKLALDKKSIFLRDRFNTINLDQTHFLINFVCLVIARLIEMALVSMH